MDEDRKLSYYRNIIGNTDLIPDLKLCYTSRHFYYTTITYLQNLPVYIINGDFQNRTIEIDLKALDNESAIQCLFLFVVKKQWNKMNGLIT